MRQASSRALTRVLSDPVHSSRAATCPPAQVRAAAKIKASVIIVFSSSGRAARLIAKYRPDMPVLTVVIPKLTTNQLKWTFTGAFQVPTPAQAFIVSGFRRLWSLGIWKTRLKVQRFQISWFSDCQASKIFRSLLPIGCLDHEKPSFPIATTHADELQRRAKSAEPSTAMLSRIPAETFGSSVSAFHASFTFTRDVNILSWFASPDSL